MTIDVAQPSSFFGLFGGGSQQYDYYEAWHVSPGNKVTDEYIDNVKLGWDDRWTVYGDPPKGTAFTFSSTFQFYEGMQQLPNTFARGNVSWAYSLPSACEYNAGQAFLNTFHPGSDDKRDKFTIKY